MSTVLKRFDATLTTVALPPRVTPGRVFTVQTGGCLGGFREPPEVGAEVIVTIHNEGRYASRPAHVSTLSANGTVVLLFQPLVDDAHWNDVVSS